MQKLLPLKIALHAAWDGFSMGLGMALSITVLGALREILGQGTLLRALKTIEAAHENVHSLR